MKRTFFCILCFLILLLSFSPLNICAVDDDGYNSEDLSDYFGTMKACTHDKSENDCRNGNEYKFYLKMYDMYYLYKNKYSVTLDLPLIMATLYYGHEELPTVFKNNLNNYDRSSVKDTSQVTNLDWEYDYKNDSCYTYLNANDSSYDMQILAKNMVKKTITYECSEGSGGTAENIETSNYSKDTLKCDKGEYKSETVAEKYEKDDEQYKKFLLEYIKLKYHTKGTEVKSCSSSLQGGDDSGTSWVDVPVTKTGKEAIDKMNEIALKEAKAGTGPQKFWNWYGMQSDWCAMFVSWLFNQIGGLGKYYVKTGAAGPSAREPIAAGYGSWLEDECTDPKTVPRAGDVLHWKKADPAYRQDKYSSKHVGYVYAVDDKYIYTVEGNHDPYHVVTVKHERKDCNINGYYRANF